MKIRLWAWVTDQTESSFYGEINGEFDSDTVDKYEVAQEYYDDNFSTMVFVSALDAREVVAKLIEAEQNAQTLRCAVVDEKINQEAKLLEKEEENG